jgi:ABC-type dipeptide/oligopeptide/nickel transport system permease component
MEILRIIAKTVFFYLLVILGATFVMYALLWAAPGDLTDVLCPKGCEPEMRRELIKTWGLDKPMIVQYGRWLGDAARFRFGTSVSLRQGAPVTELLAPAVRITAWMVLGAAFLTLLLAFFLCWRPLRFFSRWLLRLGQFPLVVLSFAPLYILAYWSVMLTSRGPAWLVQQGWLDPKTLGRWRDLDLIPFGQQVSDEAGWLALIPFFVSMVLLAIGNNNLAEQASSLRGEIEHLKGQDFMRAVRAKGASFWAHFLHNLLLPITQFFSTRAILLLGTVVIIETIMSINGVGWLLWQAAEMRDTPVVLAIALFATVLASLLQMLNEIALKLIDPRLRR